MKLRTKIQQKNKPIRLLAFCAIAAFLLSVTSLTVRAEEIGEKGENDTMETAELITANNEKPSGAVDGKHAGQSLVEGYTTNKDTDWYKVILFPGTNYMTCYGDSGYTFRITNSDGDTIVTDTFIKAQNYHSVYSFTTPASGYYYIEFQGSKSTSERYVFMIGSPTYELASCKISCSSGSVSMTAAGGTRTIRFNGSSVSGLPRDAIASQVKMLGVPSNGAASIRVNNDDRGLSFTLVKYTWYRDNLISMNLPVESTWTAELEYNKAVTFTPVLSLNYVYPVYE